jgi:D-xylose transport system substrate-binding protein
MTVWPSLKEQTVKAAQIVTAILKGQTPSQDLFAGAAMNNDQHQVPWAKVKPYVITLANMDIELADGAVTKGQLCKGMPAAGHCK